MSERSEKKQKLKNKLRLLYVVAFVQIWVWPMWFAYVVNSGPTAVSSFLTMCAMVIYNIVEVVVTTDNLSGRWD